MTQRYSEWSDARRAKHNNYSSANYSVISCKLPRDVADAFRGWCKTQGVAPSSYLGAYIRETLAANATPSPAPGDRSED